jgi:uncharacterized protein
MIEMKVAGIGLDPGTRSSVLLLKDAHGRRALPIYIGPEQASAIANVLDNKVPPRPSTHDVLTNMLDAWDLVLDRVLIHTLKDNTFYASLVVKQGEKTPGGAGELLDLGGGRSGGRCVDSRRSGCR